MSERVHEFNQVADFGDIQALIAKEGEAKMIEIGLPESQREAFETSMEQHNKGVVDSADVPALMQKLKDLAAHKYYRHIDSAYSLNVDDTGMTKYKSFREIMDDLEGQEKFDGGNVTAMNFTKSPRDAFDAVERADEFLEEQGYSDFSYVGSGTFTMAFRAKQETTGRTHIIKFAGWPGVELQTKGNDIPDNIRPVLNSPDGMPDDWFVYVFPEVLPLHKIADEVGNNTKITVSYHQPDGSNDRTNLYTAIGAVDIVNELATNSITEGYFASDTVSENIALLPDGGVKAYDMGMIAAVDNPTLNSYDPEREKKHAAKFGSLGAPFNHVDEKGVPTDIMLFQPERYNEFLPDRGPDLDLVADL